MKHFIHVSQVTGTPIEYRCDKNRDKIAISEFSEMERHKRSFSNTSRAHLP